MGGRRQAVGSPAARGGGGGGGGGGGNKKTKLKGRSSKNKD